jgi:adenylate cyclase
VISNLKLQALPRKKLVSSLLITLAVAVVISLLFVTGVLDRLEWISFDQRSKIFRSDKAAPDDVVVIMIDESSLSLMNDSLGRFPWPRGIYGDLMDFLAKGDPRAVIFDILFVENQKEDGFKKGRLGPNDRRLVNTSRKYPFIYHAMEMLEDVADADGIAIEARPLPDEFVRRFGLEVPPAFNFDNYNRYGIPFNRLYQASAGIGLVGLRPDDDGVYRRTRLFDSYQGVGLPALSMTALVKSGFNIDKAYHGSQIDLGGIEVPVQGDGSYLINMYGQFTEFSVGGVFASIAALNQGRPEQMLISPDEFKNKIVFIGTSAAGLQDIKQTSLDLVPGVLVHAATTGNIVAQDFLRTVSPVVTTILIFFFCLLTAAAILYSSVFAYQIGLPVLIVGIYGGFVFWQFNHNYVYDLVAPSLGILSTWLSMALFLTFTEGKDKRKARRMFAQYVSPEVLAEVVDRYDNELIANVGRREQVSILFSDIRNFTSIAESNEPEAVVEMLNTHLGAMVDIIINKRGTLDKFIGDAIMAFWGAPLRMEDHALRSVEAGMLMIRALPEVNKKLREKGFPEIKIGVGINTGEVILGNIGSELKLDYTVIGDQVNACSRLESLTKKYLGSGLLISGSTYEGLKGEVLCALVDIVKVKGKDESMTIYAPLALASDNNRLKKQVNDQIQAAEIAFEAYKAGKWKQAHKLYKQIVDLPWAVVMQARCLEYQKKSPSKQWDGVFIMDEK